MGQDTQASTQQLSDLMQITNLVDEIDNAVAYLGVSLGDLTPETAEQFGIQADSGAVIAEVLPSEPAAQAGVEAEDVVTAIDSEEVESSGDLLSALCDYSPGDPATLTVLRNGEEVALEVRLGEREE